MGGRSSTSGMSGVTLESLGLKREKTINDSLFKGYARTLAEDVNEYADEDNTIFSYTEGNNKAYVVLSFDDNEASLDAIISTGGGTGTKLLSKVMEYQADQRKGLYWMVDNNTSKKYYDSMGLGKYKKGKSKYEVNASQMKDALKLVKKRANKKREA